MREEQQAMLKSARENFVGSYVDIHIHQNHLLYRDKVTEVGNKLFDAFCGVVEALKGRI